MNLSNSNKIIYASLNLNLNVLDSHLKPGDLDSMTYEEGQQFIKLIFLEKGVDEQMLGLYGMCNNVPSDKVRSMNQVIDVMAMFFCLLWKDQLPDHIVQELLDYSKTLSIDGVSNIYYRMEDIVKDRVPMN